MKNTIKILLVGAAIVLPLAAFAEDAKTAVQPAVKTETTSTTTATKVEHKDAKQELTLEGAKLDNTAEIVKLAKDAGASHATFNAKTNMLTLSGHKFNKDKFTSSLSSSLPGVSVKN